MGIRLPKGLIILIILFILMILGILYFLGPLTPTYHPVRQMQLPLIRVEADNGMAVAGARVELYNVTDNGVCSLIDTGYTNSSGYVNFSNLNIERGLIKVTQGGYRSNAMGIEPYYSGPSPVPQMNEMMVVMQRDFVGINALSENCSGNYSTILWPSSSGESDVHYTNGSVVTCTGNNPGNEVEFGFFGFQGACGDWKGYNVTSGKQLKLHAYGDNCSSLQPEKGPDITDRWDIDYVIQDMNTVTNENHTLLVIGPDEPNDSYDFCYTPKGDQLQISTGGLGFSVVVYTS